MGKSFQTLAVDASACDAPDARGTRAHNNLSDIFGGDWSLEFSGARVSA